mmetsp:Transcript_37073/g.50176  ORF Transcript_37073/g.50176 Transcript_37073/m.50176 type:complete len:412 (-) Transcript_37073:154-1389(-)
MGKHLEVQLFIVAAVSCLGAPFRLVSSPTCFQIPHRRCASESSSRLLLPAAARGTRGESLIKFRTESKINGGKTQHLGPMILSWGTGIATMCLQILITNKQQLAEDANLLRSKISHMDILLISDQNPTAEQLALYSFICLNLTVFGSLYFLFQLSPNAMIEIPRRQKYMLQHQLNEVDYSYIILNILCLPGFFYNYFCLIRSFYLSDPGGISSSRFLHGDGMDITEVARSPVITVVVTVLIFMLYSLVYELIYYLWHRAMHETPWLYKWVHKHHHQQMYPDRPTIDTFNTSCVESQLGLYLQLIVPWFISLFGVYDWSAATAFMLLAGLLSVLEHDKYGRSLPFDLWKAEDHHMHHSFLKCNYSPYSTLWDKKFGTFKPLSGPKSPTQLYDVLAPVMVQTPGGSSGNVTNC